LPFDTFSIAQVFLAKSASQMAAVKLLFKPYFPLWRLMLQLKPPAAAIKSISQQEDFSTRMKQQSPGQRRLPGVSAAIRAAAGR
jgi:hypothetical protein